jgi:hypothetical protein
MKWGHIILEVVWFYFRLAGVLIAYHVAKILIAQNRPSLNPPFAKRIGGYLQCIAAVAIIGLVASAKMKKSHAIDVDYNRGATVFLVLLIPALFGAAKGYTTREEFPTNSRSDYGDQ